MTVYATGYFQYPAAALAEAERANQRALQAGAVRYAPEPYHRYNSALSSARELLRQQQERWLFRRYGPAEASLLEARRLAEEAAASASENRQKHEIEVRNELLQFGDLIERVRRQEAQLGRRPNTRQALLAAEIQLTTATWYWEQGNFDTARELLKKTTRALDSLGETADEFLKRVSSPDNLVSWNALVNQTIARSGQNGGYAIVVNKFRQTLYLYRGGRRVAQYPTDLGRNSLNKKQYRGDAATPEGQYSVIRKLGLGQSKFYKALVINYPNDHDRRRYQRLRTQMDSPPGVGGQIEIHGRGGRDENWTDGCVAVEDRVMDKLFSVVGVGTPVTIVANESVLN